MIPEDEGCYKEMFPARCAWTAGGGHESGKRPKHGNPPSRARLQFARGWPTYWWPSTKPLELPLPGSPGRNRLAACAVRLQSTFAKDLSLSTSTPKKWVARTRAQYDRVAVFDGPPTTIIDLGIMEFRLSARLVNGHFVAVRDSDVCLWFAQYRFAIRRFREVS